jgi:hypothetical protein
MREVLFPAGLLGVEDAADLQQAALGDVRTLAALPPEHVPGRVRERRDGRQGDELPRPHARVREPERSYRDSRCATTSRRRCTATKPRACSRA